MRNRRLRAHPFRVAAILLLTAAFLNAQEPEREWVRETRYKPSPLNLAGELPGERVTTAGYTSDWPSIAATRDGALHVAYVEWITGVADRIVVRTRKPDGQWTKPFDLSGRGDHYTPAIAPLPGGVLVVWPARIGDNFELFTCEISSEGLATLPQRLTRAPRGDFNVRAVADPSGAVTIVWQSFRDGNADVYARRFRDGRWGPQTRISTSTAGDWDPAVALDSSGTAWISWDSYEHGNYDVFLRSFDGVEAGDVTLITTEPTAQFHTSVAVDSQDRVWVAWDDGGENWGKDFSRASAAPGSRGLYNKRSIGLRVWAGGRLLEPQADLYGVLSGGMTRYAALPHIAFDRKGALWLVFRHWTESEPVTVHQFFATRLSGDTWTLPYRMTRSTGRATQLASLASSPGGALYVSYSSDARRKDYGPRDQHHALHYGVWVTELEAGDPASPALQEVRLPPPAQASPRRPRETMTVDGRTYHLLLGDCHRHTDIEPHRGPDGSILDTYRYAIDAAQMDFVGTADHTDTLAGRNPEGLRDYQWWWTQKAVDLMTHAPHFMGIYSYEHSMERPGGHRNLLFLKRGAPMRLIDRRRNEADNQPPNFWKWVEGNVLTQPGQKVVAVPHTFGSGPLADWNWQNPYYDSVLEIYQAFRGSYEAWRLPDEEKRGPTQTDEPGHFARDALDKGNLYGFVSFSDHFSTHNSWAAVWAEREDREGIIDGMLTRRTYAASDEIIVKVTAAGHMPGEEFTASAADPPTIEASIEAPDEIRRIDVVRNGEYIYTADPEGKTARISYRDLDASPGKSYYYLRVFQRDPENPAGDSELAWVSPFFVTYME